MGDPLHSAHSLPAASGNTAPIFNMTIVYVAEDLQIGEGRLQGSSWGWGESLGLMLPLSLFPQASLLSS